MKSKYFSTFNFQLSTAKGFTLIELLIVIAILGVLAASLLAFIDPFEQLARTRDAGRKTAVAQLGQALNANFITNGGGAWLAASTTWMDALQTAGELKVIPAAGLTTACSPASNLINIQSGYCYKRSATTAGDAIIYTAAESKAEKSKCGTSTGVWIVWSSANGGQTGITCTTNTTTQPAAGSLTIVP